MDAVLLKVKVQVCAQLCQQLIVLPSQFLRICDVTCTVNHQGYDLKLCRILLGSFIHPRCG